jgi:hypothetical protein
MQGRTPRIYTLFSALRKKTRLNRSCGDCSNRSRVGSLGLAAVWRSFLAGLECSERRCFLSFLESTERLRFFFIFFHLTGNLSFAARQGPGLLAGNVNLAAQQGPVLLTGDISSPISAPPVSAASQVRDGEGIVRIAARALS